MKKYHIFLILYFISQVVPFAVYSQSDTHRKIFAHVDNKGFFSNDEYNSPQAKGYTLIGNRFLGKINYNIGSKFSFYLGIDWLKYNGLDGFYKVKPIMGLKIKPINNLSITIGSYDVSNRYLPLPIYHWERELTNFMEEGVDIKYFHKNYSANVWLNWEKFILQGDPFQEYFTAGVLQHLNLIENKNFKIGIPIYTLFNHRGGEIDSSDTPTNTILNISTGLDILFSFENALIKSLDLKFLYYYFNQTEKIYKHNEGTGYFPTIKFNTRHFAVESGYWYGNNFYAPMGTPLFHSVASNTGKWVRNINEMAYLGIAYHYHVNDKVLFEIGSRVFYSFPDEKLDYTYGLSIRFTEDFLLYKFK